MLVIQSQGSAAGPTVGRARKLKSRKCGPETSKHWKISEITVNIEMEVVRFHVTQIICFVNCVYQQNAELNLQIGTLSHSESELLDTNSRLRESLERVREELRSTRTQIERTQQEAERYALS